MDEVVYFEVIGYHIFVAVETRFYSIVKKNLIQV